MRGGGCVSTSRIESFFLAGPAGRLECFLKSPAGARAGAEPRAVAVVCHPHPLFGGTLHNKVVHAAAEALVGAGVPALRFNFRGAGGSAGVHDGGRGESDDLRAVLDEAGRRFPALPLVVAGYSFGAFVGLGVGCYDRRVTALIGIAAPVGLYNFAFLRDCDKPLTLIQGESDPLAPLGLVLTLAASLPRGARVVPVEGAAHGFAGRLDVLRAHVAEALSASLG
jgi:uncharacterized protein